MKMFIVTAVDTSDTADGKARVLKACATLNEAKEFVKLDIKQYITNANGYPLKVDWEKLSACAEDDTLSCEWNIEEVDIIMPFMCKNTVEAAEKVLVDNGIEEDEASTVLQAIGYALMDTELYPEDEDDEDKED
jgi:hypothetical protein